MEKTKNDIDHKTTIGPTDNFEIETRTVRKVKEFSKEMLGKNYQDFTEIQKEVENKFANEKDPAQKIIEKAFERFQGRREAEFESIEDKGNINKDNRHDSIENQRGGFFEGILTRMRLPQTALHFDKTQSVKMSEEKGIFTKAKEKFGEVKDKILGTDNEKNERPTEIFDEGKDETAERLKEIPDPELKKYEDFTTDKIDANVLQE
ncbi:hypothetical protein PVAND_016181 [Polypedilum vanderplanki]|uniref:Uncharacterized protein n=1 Tax=Polypedilum vanderplanki TaxID=319348 RepID=A0A9J6BEU4_POLVA|nr:hypothetical protein PVAND_016181 [Polypedilum vanderplanki]